MNPDLDASALIAEDEPLLAAHLRHALQQAWPALRIVGLAANGAQALERTLALRPQIVFLDIRMPGLDGLEVARALAEDWPEADAAGFPLLVFVTAYDQHAVQAFELQAADYLLKPVQPARLARCLERLQTQLQAQQEPRPDAAPPFEELVGRLQQLMQAAEPAARRPPERLEVIAAQQGAVTEMVPVDDVIYFEAADKYLRVVTARREHLIRLSLRELLGLLDEQRFWQIHRGTVVQARCIARAVRDEQGRTTLELRDRPERLAVSRVFAGRFRGL
ncbi:LytR/AlgR family response regulator transcription factor [Sphaerotilus sulfidivorans]|uniref:LytR/AlgR family response regulator transcription factor n=1 Tax=Sphaerotilus sp. FB-3 TaxID=2913396 RepID=UPI002041AEDA|nr:LytTR family DNA-binding domain-containing protein [Sphaerotilus sp. FB-3]GKQ56492.1 DNA-binding response regulator [Sphaerotilus sp. FB-3]